MINMKTKAIQIEDQIHNQLKQYCDDKGLKIQKLVEKLIMNEITREKNSGDLQDNKSKG
jgi:hypothetical protein